MPGAQLTEIGCMRRAVGVYVCEHCLLNLSRIVETTLLYKRRLMKDWPPAMDWIPLCDEHRKKNIPYEEAK